jgi:thiol-disulfide isomerase/thioredoxin
MKPASRALRADGVTMRLREPKASTLIGVAILALAGGLFIKASGGRLLTGELPRVGQLVSGSALPAIELVDLAGDRFQLSSLHGKPVLLEIGATWCGPCRALLRPLRKLQSELAERNLQVITIDVGESRETVQAHYAKRELGGVRVFLDLDSRAASIWGVESLPTLVLVDAAGIVRVIRVGGLVDPDELKQRIQKELWP